MEVILLSHATKNSVAKNKITEDKKYLQSQLRKEVSINGY